MTIGERIKSQREFLGLSQEELAKKLNYKSRSTINKIEMGINDITQSKIVAFAKVLKTTPAYLLGWEIKDNSSIVDEKSLSLEAIKKNKEIFADNFNYYLKINNKTQSDIVSKFQITASTVSDWATAKKYPRVDKVQMLADYFNILKSDLTEEHNHDYITINKKEIRYAVYEALEGESEEVINDVINFIKFKKSQKEKE